MMRGRAWTACGAVLLLVVGVLGLNAPALSLQNLPLGVARGGDDLVVEMRFERADRLAPGAEVRFGQEVVGRVRSVDTDGVDAVVGVVVEPAWKIPADVFAEIRLPTALGSPFVALTPPAEPTGALVADGDVVPVARTGVGPDLESTLGSVGLLLHGSGIEQLETVMAELTDALGGRGQELGRLHERLTRATEVYSVNSGELRRTVDAADRMTSALRTRQDLLDRGMETSAEIISEAAASRDALAGLLHTTAVLVTQSEEFLDETEGYVSPTVSTLEVLSRDLASFGDRVRPTLDALTEFVGLFDGAIPGDYLLFDGALDGPGSLDALNTRGKARTGEDGVQPMDVPEIPPIPGLRTGPVDPRTGEHDDAEGGGP